ncbi:hypothetical protein [Amycolatopsis sp. CA-230715]|uniref:hypothetical protein n=1 Tax=Amycolatopsis sp. CA-230715 TaxID=2745196 RepID=UPI001C02F71F|nr:hypothetical protein [Amycolatopsis sp. CA-230715]QWF83240.1 hypothetical protein HUW46_06680 [Amycolatopsis sp. CA-230715]
MVKKPIRLCSRTVFRVSAAAFLAVGCIGVAGASAEAAPGPSAGFSAQTAEREGYVLEGTYGTQDRCLDVGASGQRNGDWVDYYCSPSEPSNAWDLWVSYDFA